jgi:uncharacterized protein
MRQAYPKPCTKAKRRIPYRLWLYAVFGFVLAACFEAPAEDFKHGLLWKIQKGAQEPSYLYGTVHSDDPRVLDLPGAVRSRLATARVFVPEVVLDGEALLKSVQAMTYSGSERLSSQISPTLYRRAVKAMADYGYSSDAVDGMRPWAVANVLSLPKPRSGEFLDLLLTRLAERQGKPVQGLETIDEQLAVLSGFPLAEQITLLKDALDGLEETPRLQEAMLRAYLDADLDELARQGEKALAQGSSKELSRRFWTALIDERNQRMAKRLEPLLARGNAFVAVGALHLPGDEGLLKRLTAQGYRLSAVPISEH